MRYPYPEELVELEEKFEVAFFVDIETSGLDAMRNEIITASISVCDYKTLEQIEEIDLQFRPENLKFWDLRAEEIHGIKLQQALQFQTREHSTNEMMRFFKRHKKREKQPLISHALNFKGSYFDQNFLGQHFMRVNDHLFYEFRGICGRSQSTIDYAKAFGGFPNYKLGTLAKHYGIELDHHNAKSDREACQKLYKIFRETKV